MVREGWWRRSAGWTEKILDEASARYCGGGEREGGGQGDVDFSGLGDFGNMELGWRTGVRYSGR